jgi:hypothetical protein
MALPPTRKAMIAPSTPAEVIQGASEHDPAPANHGTKSQCYYISSA